MKEQKYLIFNATDGVYISPTAMDEKKAYEFIKEWRHSFSRQGYYKNSAGQQMDPEDVDIKLEMI